VPFGFLLALVVGFTLRAAISSRARRLASTRTWTFSSSHGSEHSFHVTNAFSLSHSER
jgi:hypothetical protein